MRRREFIAGLGTAAVCPFVAGAQQGERTRRIGVLMAFDEDDATSKAFLSAFTQALPQLGWCDGRNVQMDVRWCGDSVNRMRMLAKAMVDPQPDVILADTTPVTAAVQCRFRLKSPVIPE
jgi:ABC-type uncharacterized transport system substrate-binding protein